MTLSTATDDQKREFEAHFRLFVGELQSLLEAEKGGEISPESVLKIKSLLTEFWKVKS
jgi:hypothetical protein